MTREELLELIAEVQDPRSELADAEVKSARTVAMKLCAKIRQTAEQRRHRCRDEPDPISAHKSGHPIATRTDEPED